MHLRKRAARKSPSCPREPGGAWPAGQRVGGERGGATQGVGPNPGVGAPEPGQGGDPSRPARRAA
eukprot:12307730-Alexandrium_andersonii.AAC.1